MHFSLAILCALEIEADPIIKSLDIHEQEDIFDPRLGFRFFSSNIYPTICLVLFGRCPKNNVERIGTQIASVACWETIRTISPKVIASVGTAGGFKEKGAKIGDVYLSNEHISFHGRHIPHPDYSSFELGTYPALKLKNQGKIKHGLISSSDSIPVSSEDHIKMQKIGTDAKDMEAAAVAEIASLAKVPVFALKAISDFVDSTEQTHQQFIANYKVAVSNLADALSFIIFENQLG